jgi:NlpC/P60 family putative phage cell wall peptidase
MEPRKTTSFADRAEKDETGRRRSGPRPSRPHAGGTPAFHSHRGESADARAAIVAEAQTWLGTPFHHQGRVKGAGVDCAMLLAEIYHRCGLVPYVDPGYYPPDWHLHRDAERYLEKLMPYAHELAGPPAPGDVAVFRYGRTFSHGAIVIAWPRLIHAYWQRGVVWGDATLYPLAARPVKFFGVIDD